MPSIKCANILILLYICITLAHLTHVQSKPLPDSTEPEPEKHLESPNARTLDNKVPTSKRDEKALSKRNDQRRQSAVGESLIVESNKPVSDHEAMVMSSKDKKSNKTQQPKHKTMMKDLADEKLKSEKTVSVGTTRIPIHTSAQFSLQLNATSSQPSNTSAKATNKSNSNLSPLSEMKVSIPDVIHNNRKDAPLIDKGKTDSAGPDKTKADTTATDKEMTGSAGPDKETTGSAGSDKTKVEATATDKEKTGSAGPKKTKADATVTDKEKTGGAGPDKEKTGSAGSDKTKVEATATDKEKTGSAGPDKTKADASTATDKEKTGSAGPDKTKADATATDKEKTGGAGPDKEKTGSAGPDKTKVDATATDKERTGSAGPDKTKADATATDKEKTGGAGPDKEKTGGAGPDKEKTGSAGPDKTKVDGTATDKEKTGGAGPELGISKSVYEPRASTRSEKSYQGGKSGDGSGSNKFFILFVAAVLTFGGLYVVYQKKQKILACIVEGRKVGGSRSRTGSRRTSGSSSSSGYKQLPTDEQALLPDSKKPESVQNFIY